MKIRAILSFVATMLSMSTLAAAGCRLERNAEPCAYRETAVFNHVVGEARFVGNFLAEPGRCDITVFETRADDGALRLPLRRVRLPIAAGQSDALDAGANSALAIACAPNADAIRVETRSK